MAENKEPFVIKRIKKVEGGAHGGAWKLALADLMTAMMAFFLVMWIIGMDVKTRAGLAEYFSHPGAFRVDFQSSPFPMKLDGRPPGMKIKIQETSHISANIDAEAAEAMVGMVETALTADGLLPRLAANVYVRVTDQGVRIDFMESSPKGVIFVPGTGELRPDAKRLLQTTATRVSSARKGIIIEGHVSTRLPGEERWPVSLARADNARRELMQAGVKTSTILSVVAKSERSPKDPGNPLSLSNDRISIFLPMASD